MKILRQISAPENNDKTVTITRCSDGRLVLLLNYAPSVHTRLNCDAPAATDEVWDVSADAPGSSTRHWSSPSRRPRATLPAVLAAGAGCDNV